MNIEILIRGLKDSNIIERRINIRKLINIGIKSSNKKEFFLIIKALKYSSNSDSDHENRSISLNGLETLSAIADKFKAPIKKDKNFHTRTPLSFSKLIFIVFMTTILISLIFLIMKVDLKFKDPELEIAKEFDVGDIFNPLNVQEVKVHDFSKGVNFKFKPHPGLVKRSHIREVSLKRVGDTIIDKTEIFFDLKQRVIRSYSDGYVIEYRTKNPVSQVPLGNFGYPDPGKVLRKTFNEDGNVKSISGDLNGIVPAMAFVNRYVFPDKNILKGEQWNADYEVDDIKTEANYKFEKILRINNKKFYYITYSIRLIYDSLDFKTVVRQNLQGEIYVGDTDLYPVFSKEVSILSFQKPQSFYSLELETTRTEIFSDAGFLLDR